MSFGCHEELFAEIKAGSSEKRKNRILSQLLTTYNAKIHKVARKYPTLEHNDSYSACIRGFYQAFEKYEYELGVHFIYFAEMYMKSECQKEYRDNRNIHIPHHHLIKIEQLNKKKNKSEDTTQIAEIEEIMAVMNTSGLTPYESDVNPQGTFQSATEMLQRDQIVNCLKKHLKDLSEKEQTSVIYFNGLFNNEILTSREIGKKLGVSHQAAINIHKRALEKIKEIILSNEDSLVDSYGIENLYAI